MQSFLPHQERASISPSPLMLTSRYFPEAIPASEKKTQIQQHSGQKDFRGKPIKKETRYNTECQLSLFVVPCFKNYPTKTNISLYDSF